MKALVAASVAVLAGLALSATAFCQTIEELTGSGETAAETQPGQEEPVEEPAEAPVEAAVEAPVEAPVKDPFEDLAKGPIYDPSKPIPAGYILEREPRRGMLIAGGWTLGGSYALALLIAIKERQNERFNTFSPAWLLIPVVGPWIAAGTSHAKCGYAGPPGDRYYYCRPAASEGLALLGGVQAVGLVLLVAAYRTSTERLVRAGVNVSLGPIGRDGYGLAVSGRL